VRKTDCAAGLPGRNEPATESPGLMQIIAIEVAGSHASG
jgi:hypothetical protein